MRTNVPNNRGDKGSPSSVVISYRIPIEEAAKVVGKDIPKSYKQPLAFYQGGYKGRKNDE